MKLIFSKAFTFVGKNMESKGVIYVITNKTNNKQYIGQAVCISSGRPWGSKRRWQTHVKQARHNRCECRLLEQAIRKYGEDSFTVEDLLECEIDELDQHEREYVNKYNSLAPNGYNLMTGGGNGRKHAKSTRERMSKTRTGKTHKEITKKRIGDANRGLKVSMEGKKNIGKASKFRNMSAENKQMLDEACKEVGIKCLPMYVCLSIDRRGGRNVPIIQVRNPSLPNKQFGKKNMSLAEKIKLAISYTQRSSV